MAKEKDDGNMLFFFGRRSQAAMEFLMTYGWAILVVLAAIGALAYFGVLSPGKFIPESCQLSPTSGMNCMDFRATQTSVHLLIMNSGGRDLVVRNITYGPDCAMTFDYSMPDGRQHLFNITGCSLGVAGRKVKQDILVTYTDVYSDFTKTASGSMTAMIY
ncbi:hypothetical protein KY363_04715 [Candidatus Woesearchaeota archaeon]|nr:hypothetical protein [Candidatus Woesearchaeota archaeon]